MSTIGVLCICLWATPTLSVFTLDEPWIPEDLVVEILETVDKHLVHTLPRHSLLTRQLTQHVFGVSHAAVTLTLQGSCNWSRRCRVVAL